MRLAEVLRPDRIDETAFMRLDQFEAERPGQRPALQQSEAVFAGPQDRADDAWRSLRIGRDVIFEHRSIADNCRDPASSPCATSSTCAEGHTGRLAARAKAATAEPAAR